MGRTSAVRHILLVRVSQRVKLDARRSIKVVVLRLSPRALTEKDADIALSQIGLRMFLMESDRQLIESANQGDPDAFGALYLRYRDWVYRLAWRFTGNREDALDVLQETFTYVLGKF
ncbi:MAG: hypothetical protein JSW66_14615, partial [Phycisphaerales bacterium]